MFSLQYPLILASGSPRRKEILEQAGFVFHVKTSDVEEDIDTKNPMDMVLELSERKARAVFCENKESIVLGADTIVSIEDEILGKPRDEADALSMLKRLSGKRHSVYTGVKLFYPEGEISFYEKTTVKMATYQDSLLKAYVKTKEPLDKAGAYGIQGYGAFLVEEIKGDYFNVVGLPLAKLIKTLEGAHLFAARE